MQSLLYAPSCAPTSNSMKQPLVRCGPYLSHILTSILMDSFPNCQAGAKGCVCRGGGESALGMAKEIDSTLQCRFTTFTAFWKYSKWSKPSGANPTTVAGTRIPLERV